MKGKVREIGTALAGWARRWWWVFVVLLGIMVVVGVGVVLSQAVTRRTDDLLSQITSDIPARDRADLTRSALQYQADNLAKVWTTIVQALGAVVLAIGASFTWRNLQVSQRTLKTTQDKLEVDREAQITNRFTQAIGQLGAELKEGQANLVVRLGGIYALERIARDSVRDHGTIMDVLATYVRHNALLQENEPPPAAPAPNTGIGVKRPSADLQAVLTVLGRRDHIHDEDRPLDLRDTNLRGMDLQDARLSHAILEGARLDVAKLRRAHLEEADLAAASLIVTDLADAHLERARLVVAHLEQANLTGAHLEGAFLGGAHLEKATFNGATLTGTHLGGTHLEGAVLTEAFGLTQSQIESAHEQGKGALLPAYLTYLNTAASPISDEMTR